MIRGGGQAARRAHAPHGSAGGKGMGEGLCAWYQLGTHVRTQAAQHAFRGRCHSGGLTRQDEGCPLVVGVDHVVAVVFKVDGQADLCKFVAIVAHVHGDCRGGRAGWLPTPGDEGQRLAASTRQTAAAMRLLRLRQPPIPLVSRLGTILQAVHTQRARRRAATDACWRSPVRPAMPDLGTLRALPSGPTGHSEGTAR